MSAHHFEHFPPTRMSVSAYGRIIASRAVSPPATNIRSATRFPAAAFEETAGVGEPVALLELTLDCSTAPKTPPPTFVGELLELTLLASRLTGGLDVSGRSVRA